MQVNETNLEFRQLHRKFINDFNLPLQVVHEPFFHERLELLEEEYGAKTKYLALTETIKGEFNGKVGQFMEFSHLLADQIVTSITNSDAYKHDFLSKLPTKQEIDIHTASIKNKITFGKKLYTQEQDGCMFVSYDMKNANFQLLRYICPAVVFDSPSYGDFMKRFTDIDYFVAAKGLRQAIFGKIKPKEVSQAELIESCKLFYYLSEILPKDYEPYSINNDEVIFKFNGNEEELRKQRLGYLDYDGITFRIERFKLHTRKFKLKNSEQELCVFEKEDILKPDKKRLFCCPATYHPQVYKLLHGLKINENDLVFYYDHELCKFMNPLELIK